MDGPYVGKIVKREKDPENDPECSNMDVLGRIKVSVPGKLTASAWAWPMGAGGFTKFGSHRVPPIGALVDVFFIDGNPDKLLWIAGHHAKGQEFPEFESPDVIVEGDENFRFVHDRRDGQRTALFKVMKPNKDGEETEVVSIRFDIEGNGLRLYAMTGLVIEAMGDINLDAGGEVKIQDRVVSKKGGMI